MLHKAFYLKHAYQAMLVISKVNKLNTTLCLPVAMFHPITQMVHFILHPTWQVTRSNCLTPFGPASLYFIMVHWMKPCLKCSIKKIR